VRVRFANMIDRDFSAPRRTFTGVLITIVLAMTFQLAAPDDSWARLVAVVLQALVVMMALGAAGADRKLTMAAVLLIAVLIVTGTLAAIGIEDSDKIVPRALTLLLALIAPAAILVGLRAEVLADKRVTLQTVFAGLSLYLLLGMVFGFVYALIQDISNDPFFVTGSGNQNDFLYYSLTTLTTTGYGDFAAAGELGRTFSVLEALFGQIYLVTVVALLVSNLRKATPEEREEMHRQRQEMKAAREALRKHEG